MNKVVVCATLKLAHNSRRGSAKKQTLPRDEQIWKAVALARIVVPFFDLPQEQTLYNHHLFVLMKMTEEERTVSRALVRSLANNRDLLTTFEMI